MQAVQPEQNFGMLRATASHGGTTRTLQFSGKTKVDFPSHDVFAVEFVVVVVMCCVVVRIFRAVRTLKSRQALWAVGLTAPRFSCGMQAPIHVPSA